MRENERSVNRIKMMNVSSDTNTEEKENKSNHNAYDDFEVDNNSLDDTNSKNASYYSILQSFLYYIFSFFFFFLIFSSLRFHLLILIEYFYIPFNFYLFASYLFRFVTLLNVGKHKSIIIILLALCRAVYRTVRETVRNE